MGYQIEAVRESEGLFRFILRGEPAEPRRASAGDWYMEKTGRPRPTGRQERPPGRLLLFDAEVGR